MSVARVGDARYFIIYKRKHTHTYIDIEDRERERENIYSTTKRIKE